MFLNGYIYVDVINGARQCAEENKCRNRGCEVKNKAQQADG